MADFSLKSFFFARSTDEQGTSSQPVDLKVRKGCQVPSMQPLDATSHGDSSFVFCSKRSASFIAISITSQKKIHEKNSET